MQQPNRFLKPQSTEEKKKLPSNLSLQMKKKNPLVTLNFSIETLEEVMAIPFYFIKLCNIQTASSATGNTKIMKRYLVSDGFGGRLLDNK